MARTGRRPGSSGTREAILAAARTTFAERGYDAASIRAVARAAGVDPALVHHYFGTKGGLFAAAMALPDVPARIIGEVVGAGPPDELGERVVRRYLELWDAADRGPLLGLLRSAMTNEAAAALLREFLQREVVAALAAALGGPDAELCAALAGSQLVGLALARYVIGLEPVARAPTDELVRRVGPVVQLHLTGRVA
jgi:AcrR family transcriptional regulator